MESEFFLDEVEKGREDFQNYIMRRNGGCRDKTGEAVTAELKLELGEMVGQGGFGSVYKATNRELKGTFAVKSLRDEMSQRDTARSRFLFEAKVGALLNNPGIAQVYAAGTDENHCPFFAMRYVDGVTLDEKIQQIHQLKDPAQFSKAFRELLRHFIDVGTAVHDAHNSEVTVEEIANGQTSAVLKSPGSNEESRVIKFAVFHRDLMPARSN